MKRCLLYFIKYPQPHFVKTRLGEELGFRQAADLYRDLAERVLTEIYPTEDDYTVEIHFDPAREESDYRAWLGSDFSFFPQQGVTLGDRLSNAFQNAFDGGHDEVLAIGSDCIGFSEDFIKTAFDFLGQRDAVIGPSRDGGYYLLAMARHTPELFDRIPWSTEEVLETTLERLESLGLTHQLLEERIDVDTIDDLVNFRASLSAEHYIANRIDRLVANRLSENGPKDDGRD